MPLELTPAQRKALSTRLMVQAPNLPPAELARVQRSLERRIEGIKAGDLLVVESLRLLAEQGNRIAADLYREALDHFGIDPKGLVSHA